MAPASDFLAATVVQCYNGECTTDMTILLGFVTLFDLDWQLMRGVSRSWWDCLGPLAHPLASLIHCLLVRRRRHIVRMPARGAKAAATVGETKREETHGSGSKEMKVARSGSQGSMPEKVKAKIKPNEAINGKPVVMLLAKYLKQKPQQNVFYLWQAAALGSTMNLNTTSENVKEKEGAEQTTELSQKVNSPAILALPSDSPGVSVSEMNQEQEVVVVSSWTSDEDEDVDFDGGKGRAWKTSLSEAGSELTTPGEAESSEEGKGSEQFDSIKVTTMRKQK
ncbi:hypothetical protein NDU88_006473 [Pleurodeles waltl]|uniref:Uncharacterized protein n=1 Tax=Pleurodeles waltl TaxID=8319 RepID=A0AAV7UMV5_PLEWA|nr:hypothetical protein NDU88_006473 [Pleurodeles waltl]